MEVILGKMEVEYRPVEAQSFILGAILGFLCSFILLMLVILIVWLVKRSK
jgi:hypothetical protein